jgi:hypothetical protein
MPAIFTNRHNIPDHIANAIKVDDHFTNGDISVTSLIDSPKIYYLKSHTTYEVDIMDMMAAFLGTGMHTALERAEKGRYKERVLKQAAVVLSELEEEKASGYLKKVVVDKLGGTVEDNIIREMNWTMEVLGWTISGTLDIYNKETGYIEDYKMTSATAFMYPEMKKSWNAQMNCYAAILRANGYEVKGARIHAFFKDWSKMKVVQNRDYPKTPYMPIEIQMLENEKVVKYMEGRVDLHQRMRAGEDIPCTTKDRWATVDTYAIMKKGNKKATRVLDSMALAEQEIEKIKLKTAGEFSVEVRPGQSKRCEEYCPVKNICEQYKNEIKSLASQSQEMEEA